MYSNYISVFLEPANEIGKQRRVEHGSNFSSRLLFFARQPQSLPAAVPVPQERANASNGDGRNFRGLWFSAAAGLLATGGEDSGQRASPSYKAPAPITQWGPFCVER